MRKFSETSLLILFCVLLVGCGKTPEKLYPVSGVVTVGGEPLNGGSVQFEMKNKGEASGKVFTASGEIGEDGSYELLTFGKPGAPAGEHRVWVSPNLLHVPDKLGVSHEKLSRVPKKYRLPTTTDLTYTVEEDENEINVEVP